MTLEEIRAEIERLPRTLNRVPDAVNETERPAPETRKPASPVPTPLDVVSRQGRLLMRLTASSESVEGRMRDLTRLAERQSAETEALRVERRKADERARQFAMETIRLIDTLDRLQVALAAKSDPLAEEAASAQRDAARRLAALGVTEIPCSGIADGRLHESVDTSPAPPGTPRYTILSAVRRGWQCGPDILRRACVITAD